MESEDKKVEDTSVEQGTQDSSEDLNEKQIDDVLDEVVTKSNKLFYDIGNED